MIGPCVEVSPDANTHRSAAPPWPTAGVAPTRASAPPPLGRRMAPGGQRRATPPPQGAEHPSAWRGSRHCAAPPPTRTARSKSAVHARLLAIEPRRKFMPMARKITKQLAQHSSQRGSRRSMRRIQLFTVVLASAITAAYIWAPTIRNAARRCVECCAQRAALPPRRTRPCCCSVEQERRAKQ